MTETKVKVLDQQGSESAYSDPKTNANTLSPTTVTTHRLHGLSRCKQQIQHCRAEQMANNSDRSSSVQQFDQFCKQVLFGVSFRIWTRFRVMFFGGSAEQKCINRGELYRTTSWWEWHRLCEKHAELCEWENPPSTHEKLFPSYMHYFLVRQKMKDVDMFSKMFLCSQNCCCCLTLFVKGVVLWRFWIFNQRSIFSIFNSSGRCWFCFDVGFWRCQMKDQC